MSGFDLKPCPFCGKYVRYGSYEGQGSCITKIRIICDRCKYAMDLLNGEMTAVPSVDVVDIWNRRPEK